MKGRTALIAFTAALLVAAPLAAVTVGRFPLSIGETLSVLCPWLGAGEPPQMVRDVIINIRLPRILLAMLAGAGLGVAGAPFRRYFPTRWRRPIRWVSRLAPLSARFWAY